jgi:Abortive infection alpha
MAKKASKPAKLKASAKVEVVAKAVYQRKKIIKEITPPDVIRAKAGAWLDLISPITMWAGLKGDALRYKREELRIHQEAALEALARTIHLKMKGKKVAQPLPPKIMVPALEGASLEDSESPLIEWWANLLVSGATGEPLRPFLVDLMKRIGIEEASLLDKLWNTTVTQVQKSPSKGSLDLHIASRGLIAWGVAESKFRAIFNRPSELEGEEWSNETRSHISEAADDFVNLAEKIGAPARLTITAPSGLIAWHYSPTLNGRNPALDVARALNIVEFYDRMELDRQYKIEIRILEFTPLGVEFMKACHVDIPTGSV